MKEYITVSDTIAEYSETIERSEFISYCKNVTDAEEALSFINGLKKQYHDATHVCYAYVLDENTKKYSDDGEPQGTAGMPILDVIIKKNLLYTCIAVVRYFGGIKLGAGGLVRAYSSLASGAVNASQLVKIRQCPVYNIVVPYPQLKTIQKLISKCGKIKNIEYDSDVNISVIVTDEDVDFSHLVMESSNGKILPTFSEYIEVSDNL